MLGLYVAFYVAKIHNDDGILSPSLCLRSYSGTPWACICGITVVLPKLVFVELQ